MRIIDFECHGVKGEEWKFSATDLQKVNLLVGDTGSGKTRFLTELFNFAFASVANDVSFQPRGEWTAKVLVQNEKYLWHLHTDVERNEGVVVAGEKLSKLSASGEETLFERTAGKIVFGNTKLPKLSPKLSGMAILQKEEPVHPVYRGFSSIMRRSFSDESLKGIFTPQSMDHASYQSIKASNDLVQVFAYPLAQANIKLSLVKEMAPARFKSIVENYKRVFPFVVEADVVDILQSGGQQTALPNTPVFCVRERNSHHWIRSNDLSSGMQKVLLILLDSFLLPEGGIYLIDEYENSLGISAIDFLPEFLAGSDMDNQYFITSHHPYIINKMPIESWIVFHRNGTNINIKRGSELKEKYGKSKQQHFIQLLNDPFYKEGVE